MRRAPAAQVPAARRVAPQRCALRHPERSRGIRTNSAPFLSPARSCRESRTAHTGSHPSRSAAPPIPPRHGPQVRGQMTTSAPASHGTPRVSLAAKLTDSVFAATALAVAWWHLLSYAPVFGTPAGDASLRLIARFPFWAVGPLLGVAYATYWHARERRGGFPSARRHAQAMALVRYVVAWMIAGYGFTKVTGLQFYLGMNWQDRPVSELNGFMLTWYYFYRSRALVLTIAAVEIVGSVLLLFPRTVLLGAALLLPLMVNVTLTDWFYEIRGPFPAALYLTLALAYLVWPYRERIAQLLFHLGARSNWRDAVGAGDGAAPFRAGARTALGGGVGDADRKGEGGCEPGGKVAGRPAGGERTAHRARRMAPGHRHNCLVEPLPRGRLLHRERPPASVRPEAGPMGQVYV